MTEPSRDPAAYEALGASSVHLWCSPRQMPRQMPCQVPKAKGSTHLGSAAIDVKLGSWISVGSLGPSESLY